MATQNRSYDDVFQSIQDALPFLQNFVRKLNVKNDENDKTQKLLKMYELLSSKRNLKFENLLKCEDVIKKLKEKSEVSPMKPSIENVEPSISILKNAVKVQSEKKKGTNCINIARKDDILKQPPLTMSDIRSLIEENDPMASSSQHKIMSIEATMRVTGYQQLQFNTSNNIQAVSTNPTYSDANQMYSMQMAPPTIHPIVSPTIHPIISSTVHPIALPPVQTSMNNTSLNRGYNDQIDHNQINQFKFPSSFSQNHHSKDPRLSRFNRMSVFDSTFNNNPIVPPIYNNFGRPSNFSSNNKSINRRKSVFPDMNHDLSTKPNLQRRQSVSSTFNKFKSVDFKRQNESKKEDKIDEISPISENNVDKLMKFPEKKTQFDTMYKSISTDTFKTTPMMGKSSFSSTFKIPKIKTAQADTESSNKSKNFNQKQDAKESNKTDLLQSSDKTSKCKEKNEKNVAGHSKNGNIKRKSNKPIENYGKIKNSKKQTNTIVGQTVENIVNAGDKKEAAGKTATILIDATSDKSSKKNKQNVKNDKKQKKVKNEKKPEISNNQLKTPSPVPEIHNDNDILFDDTKTAQLQSYLKGLNLAEDKIEKIQKIICDEASPPTTIDKNTTANSILENHQAENDKHDYLVETNVVTVKNQKKTARKKGKTELDRLNEDINDMFIRDEVLNANGKRKCTQKKVVYFREDHIKVAKKTVSNNKKTIRTKKTVRNKKIVKTASFINPKKLKRLRITVFPLVSVKNLKKPKKNPTGRRISRKPSEKRSIKLILSKKQYSNCKKTKEPLKLVRSKSTYFETSHNKRKSFSAASNKNHKRKADSVFVSLQPEAKRAHIDDSMSTQSITNSIQIRNNRFGMHSMSVYASKCILCIFSINDKEDDAHIQLVRHYCLKHSNGPNFISRFSKHSSDVLKFGNPLKYDGVFEDNILSAKCLFCDKIREYTKEDWIIHLSNHTGEYRYKCKLCATVSNSEKHDESSLCTAEKMELINTIEFDHNQLFGYLCRHCNFVQLNQKNLQKHLDTEHRELIDGELKFCAVGYKNKSPQKENILGENMPVPLAYIKKEEPKDLFDDKKVVENVAFNVINNSIWFLCLFDGCNFTTNIKEDVYQHASDSHENELWKGSCQLCQKLVDLDDSKELKAELDHMIRHLEGGNTETALIRQRQLLFDRDSSYSTETALIRQRLPIHLEGGNTIIQFSNEVVSKDIKQETSTIINTCEELITMKPWVDSKNFKSFPHAKEQTTKKSLYSFYKCLGRKCAFTCDDSKMMMDHLKNHELVGEIISDNLVNHKSWLECSYCNYFATDSKELMLHLNQSHSRSFYQCNICFYRAAEAFSVLIHHDIYHKDLDFKILVMDENLTTPRNWDQTLSEELKKLESENVKPLICTVCNVRFLKLNLYMPHLYGHSEENIECKICRESIEKKKMAKHLTHHRIFIYQCLYCDFGSNIQKVMRSHVADIHPNSYLYTFIRTKRSDLSKNETIQDSSISNDYFYLGNKLDKCKFEVCPYTKKQLNFKSVDTKSNLDICYDKTVQIIQVTPISPFPMPQTFKEYSQNTVSNVNIRALQPVENVNDTNSSGSSSRSYATTSKSSEEIDELAYKAVTNFSYKCPFKDCQKCFKNQIELHNHLSAYHKNEENLSCQYCPKVIKTQRYYVFHLKEHDPFCQRFFCYMNDFRNSSAEVVKMHIKNNHNESITKQIFYNSMKQDQSKDLIIICPSSYTKNDLKSFYQEQIKTFNIQNNPSELA